MNRRTIKVIATVAVAMAFLLFIQKLLVPKYMTDVVEGAMIGEYYDSDKIHDVIFIGDCEVYENFSPCRLWEKYGISSYIRGSAQQLLWQSYYLLEDTMHYEIPEAVVFNVLAMKYNEPKKEAYNRMTLEGMRWSKEKVKSIQASMTEEESFWEYLFPILRYHSRWKALTRDDFIHLFSKEKVTFEGYYMRTDSKPAENIPEPKKLGDYRFGDNAWLYLEKMAQLCRENGVELILVKAPSLYPYWYPEWEKQIEEFARENGLFYYNFLDKTAEIGLDFSMDTYDGGLHLNLSGAEKLSDYFGKILVEDHQIANRRNDDSIASYWNEKMVVYQKGKEERE